MNKMAGVAWFTNMNGAVGLVLTRNESGEEKAFIASVQGANPEGDILTIIDWGTKVQDIDAVKALILANGGEIAECEHEWVGADPETCLDGEQCNKCQTIRKKWTAEEMVKRC